MFIIYKNDFISKALRIAAEYHDGQKRKGKDMPYIVHPFEVAMILQKNGMNDNVVAAGLLHDILEDTPMTEDELEEKFDRRILELVKGASEKLVKRDDTLWKERKQHTINHLIKEKDLEIKYISCADKLSNIKSMLSDYNDIGEKLWDRFNKSDKKINGKEYTRKEKKNMQKWYYRNLVESLDELEGNSIYEQFKEAVEEFLEI